MASSAPTNETILFPISRDSFPTVYDANTTAAADRYTKVWAEYYNKIRNFIGKIQPLIRSTVNSSYSTDATVGSITTTYTLEPAPSIAQLMLANSKTAYDQGRAVPTNILPFEIVITSSNDDYTAWNTSGTKMLYKASASELNNLSGGDDFFAYKPMVQISVRRSDTLSMFADKFFVSHHCFQGTDTLVIRGCIISLTGAAYTASALPNLNRHFPLPDQHYLAVTFTTVKP